MKSVQQLAAMEKAQAYRTRDPERIAQASRNLAEVKITAAVERALATSPPLTPAQIRRIGTLLRGAK